MKKWIIGGIIAVALIVVVVAVIRLVPDWKGFSSYDGSVDVESDDGKEYIAPPVNFTQKFERAVEVLDDIGEVDDYLVVIDISEQKEYVFKEDGSLVAVYKVATGSESVLVPELSSNEDESAGDEEGGSGENEEEDDDPYEDRSMAESVWRISSKRDSGLSANYGPRLMLMERYYKGTWLRTEVALHGTNQPDELGAPVSLGCVYHENADIIELFDLVSVGTFVVAVD